jgi:hypothetical protein
VVKGYFHKVFDMPLAKKEDFERDSIRRQIKRNPK